MFYSDIFVEDVLKKEFENILIIPGRYTYIRCIDRQEAEEIIEDIYKQLKE